jgi:Ufm1-specific protease 1
MIKLKTEQDIQIPSIKQIQEILVKIGDKESSFIGSRDWIGGVETCYVIDELFQVPCFLHHISSSEKLSSKTDEIVNYFKNQGGLIAMGGDQDAASKLIAGVNVSKAGELSLLVVVRVNPVCLILSRSISIYQDPHYQGIPKNAEDLIQRGYVKWQLEAEFIDQSFYNLCMPNIIK